LYFLYELLMSFLTRISHDLATAVSGKQLENVRCAKLLALEIDHELTFNPRVDKICIKLSQWIGIWKRIKCCLPLKHRLLYYNTMIRPIIDYVSVVWTSCDKHTLTRVLKLQKRAARVILDADRQANSVKLFNKLNWIPFTEQAKLIKCCITKKRLQGHVHMNYNVICSKFTTKPRLRELFSTLCHLHAVFTWVFFSSLLLWEFVHDKIYKFALRKRGFVVKLASLT